MKGQLGSVFVFAAVACGGRGGEEPPVPAAGTTDVPQTQARAPVQDDIDRLQPIEHPVPVDAPLAAPQPMKEPVPFDGRAVPTRATDAPAPVSDRAQPKSDAWQARAPERYVITTCGSGAAPPACSVEAVDEGRLVSRSTRFLPSEPWAAAPIDDGQEPVASLFEQARSSSESCTTSFELDPVYAYPSYIYFDCGEEGWGERVTCFEPDTLDLSRCQ